MTKELQLSVSRMAAEDVVDGMFLSKRRDLTLVTGRANTARSSGFMRRIIDTS